MLQGKKELLLELADDGSAVTAIELDQHRFDLPAGAVRLPRTMQNRVPKIGSVFAGSGIRASLAPMPLEKQLQQLEKADGEVLGWLRWGAGAQYEFSTANMSPQKFGMMFFGTSRLHCLGLKKCCLSSLC